MNLRDFLDRCEKELTERHTEHRRRAIPLEAELAEIQRAINAIPQPKTVLTARPPTELRQYLDGRERDLKEMLASTYHAQEEIEAELEEARKVKAAIGRIPANQFRMGDGFGTPLAEWEYVPGAVGIPYESMTIKELVLKALKEHFPQGATIGQLIEFFREKWGRNIDRPSLSPQLSRLYAARQIGQFEKTREWYWVPLGDLGGRLAFRNRVTGEINWKFPQQAREDDVPGKLSAPPALD